MNLLFIGGTGVISFSCVKEALKLGYNVTIITRGRRRVFKRKIKKINIDCNSSSLKLLKKKLTVGNYI